MGQFCGKRRKITSADLTQRVEIKDFDAEGKEHSNQPSNKSSQHSHPESGMFLILILYVVCL